MLTYPWPHYPHMIHQQVNCNDCLRALFIVICTKCLIHYGEIVPVQLRFSSTFPKLLEDIPLPTAGVSTSGLRTSLLLLAQVSSKIRNIQVSQCGSLPCIYFRILSIEPTNTLSKECP